MNKAIEFHDSTLKEVNVVGKTITLSFVQGYIHKSEGIPAIDKGTAWGQTIHFVFEDAFLNDLPSDLPNEVSNGSMIINKVAFTGVIPLPAIFEGEIEIELVTMSGNKLHIAGKKFKTIEIDDEHYIEEFPGSSCDPH